MKFLEYLFENPRVWFNSTAEDDKYIVEKYICLPDMMDIFLAPDNMAFLIVYANVVSGTALVFLSQL